MIRREVTLPDGGRCWSLISQIEHARLSAEIAAIWGSDQVTPVICAEADDSANPLMAVRREAISAIRHHDDGWATWQMAPGIDPAHGRPYAFTEMPLAESLDIWKTSVLGCEALGDLSAWMVAGHFAELLRGSHSQNEPSAQAWLKDMDHRRERWLAQWRSAEPTVHTQALAESALVWLRSFDALSLWLCCDETQEFIFPPKSLPPLQGQLVIRLDAATKTEVSVDPWPFRVQVIELETPTLVVPVDEYRASRELLEAGSSHVLHWRLQT